MVDVKCKNPECKHEKRFHVNPENHVAVKTSACTKVGCSCVELI